MRLGFAPLILWLLVASPAVAQVPRSECFPVERLPAALRARAEAVLLESMDHEALYTVIGGLKPMTSAFLPSLGPTHSLTFDRSKPLTADSPIARQLDDLRQVFSALRCGDDIQSAVLVDILNVSPENSMAEVYVFHMPALRGVIDALPGYFAPLNITTHTSPETVLFTMHRLQAGAPERGATGARREWARAHDEQIGEQTRATGLLYGYPRAAVDAYAALTVKAIRGELPPDANDPRLMMRIANFTRDSTWYRKETVEESADDRALRERAGRILAEYKKRREQYVGNGKPGIVALLRDWFCKGDGGCSAANADVK